MNREDVVKKVLGLLNNLDGICTNSIKAETVVDELENLGLLQTASHLSKTNTLKNTTISGWEN